MSRYSLDTNIISYVLKRNRPVSDKLEQLLKEDHEFVICPVVYYELRRGLLKKEATAQLAALKSIVSNLRWLDFRKEIWHRAAQGWVEASLAGRQPKDADLLIAFHAHYFSAILVTNNVKDFETYPVTLENWVS